MASINPYLNFDGNCEEVFNFYKSVFGGEFIYLGRFSEMPEDPSQGGQAAMSAEVANRIMHVSLPIGGGSILMGSDVMPGYGAGFTTGNNFSISLNTESTAEADKLFAALSAGGTVVMPMNKTFWGSYFGMFNDKFGIQWMVSFDENQAK